MCLCPLAKQLPGICPPGPPRLLMSSQCCSPFSALRASALPGDARGIDVPGLGCFSPFPSLHRPPRTIPDLDTSTVSEGSFLEKDWNARQSAPLAGPPLLLRGPGKSCSELGEALREALSHARVLAGLCLPCPCLPRDAVSTPASLSCDSPDEGPALSCAHHHPHRLALPPTRSPPGSVSGLVNAVRGVHRAELGLNITVSNCDPTVMGLRVPCAWSPWVGRNPALQQLTDVLPCTQSGVGLADIGGIARAESSGAAQTPCVPGGDCLMSGCCVCRRRWHVCTLPFYRRAGCSEVTVSCDRDKDEIWPQCPLITLCHTNFLGRN